jgi:hypothetical protein
MEAFKIFISSIIFGSKCVTENETDNSSIIGFSFSLVFSESFFESFNNSKVKSLGSITAAAVTGQASSASFIGTTFEFKF